MKTLNSLSWLALSACFLLPFPSSVEALDERSAPLAPLEFPRTPAVMGFQEPEGILLQGGALFRIEKGLKQPISGPIRFGSDFNIGSDGEIKQSTAALWRLTEGQMLFKDGSLMREDGSMTYLGDHYLQQAGRLVKVTAGKQEPVAPGLVLPNGIVVREYGRMVMPNGHISIFQDGQILRPDGEELSSWDTIQFHNGAVTLFKDGSKLALAPGRLMMMNDGTKVWGNGMISRRTRESGWDEVKYQLPDGAVVRLPRIAGATNQRRARLGY